MLPTGRSTGNRFLPVASGEATNGLELRSPAEGPAVGPAILAGRPWRGALCGKPLGGSGLAPFSR